MNIYLIILTWAASAVETDDERVVEKGIVNNIKEFIMRMGKGFSFIGNQHRLVVDEDEFYIDLLFYNRILKCLVAFELKKGKFRPQDAGQLNRTDAGQLNRTDFHGLNKCKRIIFVIFLLTVDNRTNSMNEFVTNRVQHQHLIFTLLNLAFVIVL